VGCCDFRDAHGLPYRLREAGLAAASGAFFALPAQTRRRHRRPGLNRGHTLGIVQAGTMKDFYEAYTVGSQAADFPASHCRR
jgi:hypothetical protein